MFHVKRSRGSVPIEWWGLPQKSRGRHFAPRASAELVRDAVRLVFGELVEAESGEAVKAFLSRHLGHAEFPCRFLDAACLKVRNRLPPVTAMAMVPGRFETAASPGCGRSPPTQPRPQRRRGPGPARRGPAALQGALRPQPVGPRVSGPRQHMATAILRTVFAQPDAAAVREARGQVSEQLAAIFSKTGELTADTKTALLAFTAFPNSHRQKI